MAATRRPPKKLGKKHLGRSVSSSSLKAPPTPANGSPARPKTKEQQGVGAPGFLHGTCLLGGCAPLTLYFAAPEA